MDLTEKKVSSQMVYEGKVVRVEKRVLLAPNGKTHTKEIVHHCQGAAILPINNEGKIILERQFRSPLNETIYAVPAGKDDRNEPLDVTAKRELEEETGMVAGTLIPLGKLYTSPAYTTEVIGLYVAYDLTKGKRNLDPFEFIDLVEVTEEEFFKMCQDGRINDARSLALAYRFLNWKQRK